ncbi:helix-turn-helix transcriptional regulator [Actinoplanes couchii]|uniref:DeoR family transcriptional regulator n=1 Tax=Actinoplanes couchii TaxID=403638 RepID=A0ABQ3XPP9_9ACTN|nr:WYL domain-containing protein [Actinoplanes couchii]MDR6319151.1 putative DNA-binding transcriptional regulator YafY [Actinoplanes couchii]GID60491.1 DeoR family transcriptional regulator [Actinoplanes couchii]
MPKTSARLLSLLSLLQARRDWPGGLLADRLEVSARTVRRDVDRLRELGYPIRTFKGPDGGYRLEAGSQMPPLLFDDDQAVAITVALQLAATSGAGIEEGAARALHTVRQVLPARLRHRVDSLRVTAVAPGTAPSVDPAVLTAVGQAVHAREVFRFDYGPEAAFPRRVEPHHLVSWKGRWYLLAWDLERDDWRTFRVDRLSPRTPNGPRFAPRSLPAADVATFVTGRFRGSTSGDWPCVGEVIVDRPAESIVTWAPDGIVEEIDDSRCRLVQGSWSWVALAASLGRFDADIEVVGPPELAEACATLAARYGRVS